MPRATCAGTSERKKRKKQQNKTNCRQKNSPSTARTTKVRRGHTRAAQQQSQKSNSSPVASPDSTIVDRLLQHAHLSAELLILPLLTPRATRRQRHVPGSRPPFLLDSADFRSILPLVCLVHCAICNTNVVLSLPIQVQAHTRLKTSVPQLIHNVQLKHKTTATTGLETQAKHRLQGNSSQTHNTNNWDGTTCSTQDNNKTKLEQGCSILMPTTTNYQQRPTDN